MIDKRFYELITHLWRAGAYGYLWTPDDGQGDKYTYWIKPSAADVPKLFLDKDAYFAVNPATNRKSEHERAKIADIAAINCFYDEVDCKTDNEKRAALEKIAQRPIQPACVTDSGGGYHCFTLLKDTFADIARAADLQWAFAQWAGGDTSVNDLARVLRIPGTINHKPRYAPTFPTVLIVRWDMSQLHDIRDIETVLQPYIDARDAVKAHTPPPPCGAVSLSDQELLDVLFKSKNGDLYRRLWGGDDLGDHSVADQKLCNGLAWVTGRDTARMDSLFRQSGLYRAKWETKSYREKTLNNAANSAQTVYDPAHNGYIDPQAVAAAQAAVGGGNNGSQPPPKQPTGGGQTQQPSGGNYKVPSNPTTQDYIDALRYLGYHFRLNDLDDKIEVNGQRLTDVRISEIKNRMRDLGFKRLQINDMQDAYIEEAGRNRYHPIREYLLGIQWDGDDHIRLLAKHFEDKHPIITYDDGTTETVFYVWLKRWLIAAVAKTFQQHEVAAQNAVLVLEGGQNLGKSTFARWLCSGMPRYFIEKSIDPDSKEDERRLASNWIWEIGELGATTRKADREALKSFLTKAKCVFRNAYAKEDSEKLALASFVGTVNNEGGFLQDATGTRRFVVVGLNKIHHTYVTDVDIDQLWAQAYYLFATGETWRLTDTENVVRAEINNEYKIEDAYEGWILRYFDIDMTHIAAKTPGWFTTTQEIVNELRKNGVTDNTQSLTNRLAATMKELGLEKSRQYGARGARGYWGVKVKP